MRKFSTSLVLAISCLGVSAYAQEDELSDNDVAEVLIQEEESDEIASAEEELAVIKKEADCGCPKQKKPKP
jgi:hypothetical protein